jgi:hypothetical protein
MGIKVQRIRYAVMKKAPVSTGVALRTARVAGMAVEDLLAGKWRPAGPCPLCGHVTEAP